MDPHNMCACVIVCLINISIMCIPYVRIPKKEEKKKKKQAALDGNELNGFL